MYGGESSHLPLKINTAGVIPAIFASITSLPITISNFGFAGSDTFLKISSMFTGSTFIHVTLCFWDNIFHFFIPQLFNPKATRKFKEIWRIHTRHKTW